MTSAVRIGAAACPVPKRATRSVVRMKKGGKVMKMRGGGMASRGLNFRMR